MDWSNVTAEELLSSLQEVDWSQPPRPLSEFLGKFSVPASQRKLETRLKCNTYYYRTNYALALLVGLLLAFIRNPAALLALVSGVLGGLCLNNTFATSLRAPGRTKLELRIAGVPRPAAVGLLDALCVFLLFRRGALLYLAALTLAGCALVLLHAAFKVPNLKARLASAREEFRAVWRGYQAGPEHDYTL